MFQLPAPHPPLSTATPGGGLDVLAVCPRGQTLQDLRAAIAQWPVPAFVRWTCDPVDALRLAVAQPPALVVMDARLKHAGGRALVDQLARWRADLDVLAFDEPQHRGARSEPSLWHWGELPRVLRWWLRRRLDRAPLFDSQPADESQPAPLPACAPDAGSEVPAAAIQLS